MISSIIIARSSTDRHDVSCKSQITEIKAEIQKKGEHIVKVLEFPRIKHTDFLEDPDFKDILAQTKLKDREWTKIWFYDTSRLSRNRMKAQTTKAFFRRHGIELEFLKVPKTGEEAVDNVIEGILETFDQLLSDFSRAGSIRGQRQNIRAGYRAGGRAPFGYQLKKHNLGINIDNNEILKSSLEPHPENFSIVKEYLTRRADKEARNSIIRDFNTRNIQSPSGNPYWSSSTCSSIENNLLTYCGHLVYNRHNRKIDGKYIGGNKFRPENEWEINKASHVAAITEEQANAIKAQLKKQKDKIPKSRKYLLTGLLYCGVCHGPMVGDSGFYVCSHKKKHITECSNSKILSDFIDKNTIIFIKDTLLSKVHFQKIVDEVKKEYKKEVEKLNRNSSKHKKRLSEIEKQLERLFSLYERGNISLNLIEDRMKNLEKEKTEINDLLQGDNQYQTAIKFAESELDNKIIKSYVDQFQDLLNESNVDLMREFIKTFIYKIELSGRENGKKRGRKLKIHSQIPALTGIELASPGGVEPPLQDRKS